MNTFKIKDIYLIHLKQPVYVVFNIYLRIFFLLKISFKANIKILKIEIFLYMRKNFRLSKKKELNSSQRLTLKINKMYHQISVFFFRSF